MNLGRTIKVLRTAAGVSQKAFAQRLDISPSYLSLIESDEREPSVSLLRQVSRLLSVPVGVFFMSGEDAGLSPDQRDEQRRVQEEFGQILQRLLALRHGVSASEAPGASDDRAEPPVPAGHAVGGPTPEEAGHD